MPRKSIATIAIILVFVAIVSPNVLAQQPEAAQPLKRFPWDSRPGKCFLGQDATAFPECRPSPDWATYAETRMHVDLLWPEPDFDLIERAANELGFSRDRFATGEYLFEPWYASMQSAFQHSRGHYAALASNWVTTKGGDGYAKLAEALVQYGNAWDARGYGYGNTVSPEAWQLYYKKLEEVNSILDAASPKLKQTGPWYVLKLQIAFQSPNMKSKRLELLQAAGDAWPEYVSIYSVPMQYAHPRWGGSFDVMDGVARYAADKTRAQLGDAMYSIAYERALRGDDSYTLRDTEVNWTRMKQGFRDVESRGLGQPWIWRNFAALACQMRDRDEARRLYGLYDSLAKPVARDAIDSCRQFAMSN